MRSRPLRAGLLAVVVLAFLFYGGSSLARVWHLQQEVERLERETAALRAQSERLNQHIDRLRHDPDAIEQVAREQLGLTKPDEQVLKFPKSPGG